MSARTKTPASAPPSASRASPGGAENSEPNITVAAAPDNAAERYGEMQQQGGQPQPGAQQYPGGEIAIAAPPPGQSQGAEQAEPEKTQHRVEPQQQRERAAGATHIGQRMAGK